VEAGKADSSLTTPELKYVRAPIAQNDTFNFDRELGRQDAGGQEFIMMRAECLID
jgi:hypothetical protein